MNFGAIGVVIGHEMTHGFDDLGSRYDAVGNVRDWWTKEDKTRFDAKTGCEMRQYGASESVPDEKLNGKLTLGENTADNGGMRIAYAALGSELAKQRDGSSSSKKIDGFTSDQRFFSASLRLESEHAPGVSKDDGQDSPTRRAAFAPTALCRTSTSLVKLSDARRGRRSFQCSPAVSGEQASTYFITVAVDAR